MSELIHALVLLGVLQGAVLGPVLWRRRANRLANRILAALVVAVSAMMLLGEIGGVFGFAGHPHLLGLGASLPFAFGPLLYLYVVALTRPVERFDPRWVAHALPLVAHAIFMTLVFYTKDGDTKVALARAADAGQVPFAFHAVRLVQTVQAFAYLGLSWRALDRYGAKMRGFYGDLAQIDLRWLRALVASNVGVWSVVLVGAVLRAVGRAALPLGAFVQIGSALAIFVTGYVSLWQPELAPKASAAQVAVPPPSPKYQRNRVDDAEARALAAKVEALMSEDHLYRNSALTLQGLADALGVPAHTASQILNVHLGKSFFVLVNTHRVAALERALIDPKNADRGVLELAFEVGFSSKSTVNSFFKKISGTTPSAFRERNRGPKKVGRPGS